MTLRLSTVISACVILGLGLVGLTQAATNEVERPPNIVFVLIDDQGWTDTGTRMDPQVADSASDYYETPNIDALARQSLRFSDAYAPAPICTPSRASIFTGKSPQQLGFTDILESRPGGRRFTDLYAGKKLIGPLPVNGFPGEEATIAEVLKTSVIQDYATAHFGKWHVGGGGPGQHGFEAHDGSTGNHGLNAHGEDPNPKDVFGITGRAIAFMRSQVQSQRPFFMQLSHYANHVPLSAMNNTIEKYRNKTKGQRHVNPVYAALNENLDTSIGRLLSALKELGIEDNTYVILTSDNGGSMNIRNPVTNNAPLRKGKTWVYEGGIRVPLMVRGPGIAPGVSAVPVIGWDLFPTFCSMLGCDNDLPPGIEGGSLLPLLLGKSNRVNRLRGDALFWHFPHYLSRKGTTPQSAIRLGNFKLIRFYQTGKTELYDLANDIGETTNVSEQYAEVTQSLEQQLKTYLSEIGAGMPVENTAYSP